MFKPIWAWLLASLRVWGQCPSPRALKHLLLWCLWMRSNTSRKTICREFLLPWVWTGSCSFSSLPLSADPSYFLLRFIRTSEIEMWPGPGSSKMHIYSSPSDFLPALSSGFHKSQEQNRLCASNPLLQMLKQAVSRCYKWNPSLSVNGDELGKFEPSPN